MALLDGLESILPKKYDISLVYTPPEGNCMVISTGDVNATIDELEISKGERTTRINFYVRLTGYSGINNEVQEDLESYFALIEGYTGMDIGGKRILYVSPPIIPSGVRDSNGFYIFSMNFNINYE